MNAERFTVKARESLSAAREIAFRSKNTEVLPVHLLAALVRQDEGIVSPLLKKLGIDMAGIGAGIEEMLSCCKFPLVVLCLAACRPSRGKPGSPHSIRTTRSGQDGA